MTLVELTEVPDEALPLAELREHLRLGTGFSDDGLQDGLLTGFLRAALSVVEGRTGKALIERTFALTLRDWVAPDRQPLPVAPVAVVASVTLADAWGVATPAPNTGWRLDPDAARPCLAARGAFLPAIPSGGQATIVFDAGYGPEWDDVPAGLGQAVLMLAGHYHEHRHEAVPGPGCVPFGVTALIERFRPLRLSGRAA